MYEELGIAIISRTRYWIIRLGESHCKFSRCGHLTQASQEVAFSHRQVKKGAARIINTLHSGARIRHSRLYQYRNPGLAE